MTELHSNQGVKMQTKTILHGFIDNKGTWIWKNNILFLKPY